MTTFPAATPPEPPRWRLPATARSPRIRYTLAAFMAAAFGIGLTQGGAAGVIQDQVADFGTTVDMVGYTIVAYALGVVVGAPLIMVGLGRVNRRPLLCWLSVAFVITTVATMLAPTIESLMVVRFLSGLPHGALMGVASFIATSLLGRARRGLAISIIMLGLTTSAIVGVPAMQWISEAADWRTAYGVVLVVGVVSTAGIWAFTPSIGGNPHASLRSEVGAIRGGPVWVAIIATTVGFAGFAAVFSYVVPLLEELNGLSASAVTWVLAAWGVGMSIGAAVGGRLSDRSPVLTARIGLTGCAVVLLGLGLWGNIPAATVTLLVLLAMNVQIFSQSAQGHLMDVVHVSPTLGSAVSHAALNAANALGAGVGALVIAAGWGYQAPAWVALGLTAAALVLVLAGPGYRTAVPQTTASRVGT